MRWGSLSACALALSACASLPPITPTCGNGVLDPGEDCDTPSARCDACGWRCDDSGSCADIPAPRDGTGYACGVDGFCHAPGGQLAGESAAQPFEADRFYVTDVDDDRIGDAVGLSVASIATRFGDPSGALTSSRETAAVTPAGAPAIADLDGDGHLDAILPARDGIVAYASPHRAISPLAFALEAGNLVITPYALISIDGKRIALLVEDPFTAGALLGEILDISSTSLVVTQFPLCDSTFTTTDFDSDLVDSYDTTDASGPSVAFTFIAKNASGTSELCGVSIVENNSGNSITYAVNTSPAAPAPARRPVLAMLDSSTCPSVVISDGGPAAFTRYITARQPNGTCAVAGSAQLPPLPGAATDQAVGRVHLDPPMNGVAPDALVTTSGVFGIGALAQPFYLADRPLTAAVSGDVNGDHREDGIAAGADQTIDILYRTVAPDGFVRQRLATAAPPSHLAVADFDGNGAADIAYVESRTDSEALEIAYGTPDHPAAPTEVANFHHVSSLVQVSLPDSSDPIDVVADIGVLEQRTFGTRSLAVASGFHGSPNRALIPYLDPRGTSPHSVYRAIAGGHFVSTSTSFDMLAFEIPDPPAAGAMLWRFAGSDPGAVSIPVPNLISSKTGELDAVAHFPTGDVPIVDCALQPGDAFCIDGGALIDWPTSDTDLAIAIDTVHAAAMIIDPGALDTFFQVPAPATPIELAAAPITCDTPTCLPAGAQRLAIYRADLVGTGAPVLVLAFDGGLLACTPSTAGLACTDLVAQLALAGTCRAAAPGRFAQTGQHPADAPRTSADLVVVCDTTAYRVFAAAGALHAEPFAQLPLAGSTILGIAAHDVTGDLLDDLLVLARDADGVARLHVFPQRTSREVTP